MASLAKNQRGIRSIYSIFTTQFCTTQIIRYGPGCSFLIGTISSFLSPFLFPQYSVRPEPPPFSLLRYAYDLSEGKGQQNGSRITEINYLSNLQVVTSYLGISSFKLSKGNPKLVANLGAGVAGHDGVLPNATNRRLRDAKLLTDGKVITEFINSLNVGKKRKRQK